MDPPAVRKFLRQIGRELRDLGPFERHKALSEIRADITDLAMDGHPSALDKKKLDTASRSMPSPHEVAQTYLASAKPPYLMTRLSLAFNLLLSLGSFAAGIWLMPSVPSYPGSRALPASFIILLIASGLFGVAVYGLALIRPKRAARWRYAVLPAIVVSMVFDAILGTIAAVNLNWPLIVGVFVPIVTFFGGVYSIAYAHGQLPRLLLGELPDKKGRDYFRILGWYLRDLDRAKRGAILAELRNHVASSGVDLVKLGYKERYARIVEVLGHPNEIASGYLREASAELSKNQRWISNALFIPTMIGIIVGADVLFLGLRAETFAISEQSMTFLGIVGSTGLFIVSIAALAGLLHVRRAPMHWPDVTPPTAIFALTAALIIAAVFGVIPTGGVVENTPRRSYSIDFVHSGPGGNLDVYWTGWSYSGEDSPLGIPYDATRDESVVTRLDQSGLIISSETVPVKGDYGWPIALDRVSDSWVALYSEGYATWGAMNAEGSLGSHGGSWNFDGRIDGGHLAVSRLHYDSTTGTMTVRSASLTLPNITDQVTWEKTVAAPQIQTPWSYGSQITVGENRTLATVSLVDGNSTSSRSAARSYLFDENGVEIANVSLINEQVALNGIDDRLNSTSGSIDGAHYVGGAFWVVGHSQKAVNGTALLRAWAFKIDAIDGSSTMYELHRLTLPYLREMEVQSSEGDPWYFFAQATEADVDSIAVVSVLEQGSLILDPYGRWEHHATSGNLTVSRLTADGSLDFSVSLFDIPAGSQWFFFGTMISIYEGSPSVFIPDLPSSSSSGVMRVRTFTVIQPSHAVQEAEITLDITEAMFFYECMLRSISGFLCLGNGVAPGIAVLAGQAFYEDRGIFDWRGEGPAIAKAPAILRLDALSGTSTVIPLAPMDRMSDTLAGLIAVTVVAIAAVVALATGYPFLRARRILKAGQREQMPEAKEPR